MTGAKALVIVGVWLALAAIASVAFIYATDIIAYGAAFTALFFGFLATSTIIADGRKEACGRTTERDLVRDTSLTLRAIKAIVGIWLIAGFVSCAVIIQKTFDAPGLYFLGLGFLLYFTTKTLVVYGRERNPNPAASQAGDSVTS